MTPGDLQSALRASNIFATGFGGANYACPTVAWLTGPCYNGFRQQLFSAGITAWMTGFNCRMFTLACLVYADACDALTVNAAPGTDTLAIGSFWFVPGPERFTGLNPPLAGTYSGEGHAVIVALTDDGIKFMDPQSGTIWDMTQGELNSARLVFFP